MSFLFSEIPFLFAAEEIRVKVILANALAIFVCFAGVSLWFRWLFPLVTGKLGREPVCFRLQEKSTQEFMLPSPPVLLAGFWIALILFINLKSEFSPPQENDPINLNILISNAILQLGVGGFLLALWEFSTPAESSKLVEYFRVKSWKNELTAGAELMLLAMPITFLLALVSFFWKNVENMHPLLQAMQQREMSLLIGIGITAVIIAPLVEELMFRVLLLNGLIEQGNLNRVAAWIAVSVCFSLVHGFADALQLFPLSLALGWCLLRRQSYLAIIVAHALFNGFMLMMALLTLDA